MVTVRVPAADIPPGESRRIDPGGKPVCVVNLGAGGFRAIDDICSHAEAYLHEGEVDVDEETIECPRHGSTFDLNTGKPVTLPATLPVERYGTTMDGTDIQIEVN